MKYLFFICNGIALLANLMDVAYFPFTLSRTTFSVFSQFGNENNLVPLFLNFFVDYWYMVLFLILLMWLMIFLYKKIKMPTLAEKPSIKYYIKALLLIPIVSAIFVIGARGGILHSTRPITMSNAGDYVQNQAEIHLVLNTPFCLIKTIFHHSLEKKTYFSDKADLEKIYNPIRVLNPNDTVKKYNIVLIILESFGKESIGFFNNNLYGYTPFVDSLCTHSLVFQHSFANGRKSIDILPSTMLSIPSLGEPFVLTEYFSNNLKSLPQILKEENYHTSFFHGAPNGSMGFSALTNLIGIDHYFGKNEFISENKINTRESGNLWGIWDEDFFKYYAKKINEFEQPFFTSIFSLSSHHPYDLPEKYKNEFPEGKHPIYRTIGYSDFALKEFFEAAQKMPWFENTIFVITADHCQSTPTHDEYNTSTGLFSVPIIFYSANEKLNLKGNSEKLIQQIDIMPTLLGMINYNKSYFSFGNDALNAENHFLVNYVNGIYQVFYGDFVLHFDGTKTVALFDYKKDILLQNNLHGNNQELQLKMEDFAKAFVQQYNNRIIENRMTVD
ncbi:MAG: LTA synthase family protein [Bacteroidetes bacterium]|nr:LTA synthase family protein [Bacteroidota bacterium]